VLLTVVTTYRGSSADSNRGYLSRSHDALTRDYLNFYAENHPDIKTVDSVKVEDDDTANVITVREKYRLPSFWRAGKRSTRGWLIDDEIVSPEVRIRKEPVRIRHPRWVRHKVRARGIVRLNLKPKYVNVENDGLAFTFSSTYSDEGFDLKWNLRSLADHIAADQVAEHLQDLDQISHWAGHTAKESWLRESTELSGWFVGAPFLLFLVWAAAAHARQKWALPWNRRKKVHQYLPGESPETAIAGPLADALLRIRCSCGGPLVETGDDATAVRYEDEVLWINELRCLECDGTGTCYITGESDDAVSKV